MKTAATVLFLSTLVWSAYGGDKWNDALSSPTVSTSDTIAINTQAEAPIAGLSGTQPSSAPGVSSHQIPAGRSIIIAHLNQIKTSQLMINTITLEPYWQGVFAASGHPELYSSAQPEIQIALEAGLSPYLRGQTISAEEFANAAIAALEKIPVSPATTAADKDLPRH